MRAGAAFELIASASDGSIAAPAAPPPSLTQGMIELRHVAGSTRPAYNAIYAGAGIRQPEGYWEWLLDLLDLSSGHALLDVACGEGQLSQHAATRGVTVTGVDLSEQALAKARAAVPGGGFVAANGEALPFPDASFDRVTNIGSLEHYENPARGAAEMARVLAPDGLALVLVPNSFGLRWSVLHAWTSGDVHDDGQPIQRYGTRGQWSRLLVAAGFRIEAVRGYEERSVLPRRLSELPELARHPSRLLIPVMAWLPVDMASMLVFVCRRASRQSQP